MADKKLTVKQRVFVNEYLIDLNATAAAIRAGFKHSDIGRQLLTKNHVSEAITKALDERKKVSEITAEKVLNDIIRIGNSAEEAGKHSDALKARELLGKYLKLFTDKVEHSGTVDMIGEFKINLVKP